LYQEECKPTTDQLTARGDLLKLLRRQSELKNPSAKKEKICPAAAMETAGKEAAIGNLDRQRTMEQVVWKNRPRPTRWKESRKIEAGEEGVADTNTCGRSDGRPSVWKRGCQWRATSGKWHERF
jgi:hypothetical protein